MLDRHVRRDLRKQEQAIARQFMGGRMWPYVVAAWGGFAPRNCKGFTVYRPDHWVFEGTQLCYSDVFGATALAVAVSGGVAYATIPDSNGIINGCYKNRAGADDPLALMDDLRAANVDFLTIGQYLQPSVSWHLPVDRWVHPEEFDRYKSYGEGELDFAWVESGPLVRSSYKAGQQFRAAADRITARAR